MSITHWYAETDESSKKPLGWKFLPVPADKKFTTIENGDKNLRFTDVSDLTPYVDKISNATSSFAKCDNYGTRYDFDGTIDHVHGFEYIRDLYYSANKEFDGRFSVPVLYDIKTNTIVNNESDQILRMFSDPEGLLQFVDKKPDSISTLYPDSLAKEIDQWNENIFAPINMGVYKAGFADQTQEYEKHLYELFDNLDGIEKHLKSKYNEADLKNPEKMFYILGDQLTETDIRLYVTIIRFDPVYYQQYKCNLKMIRHDYPYLNNWLVKLYHNPKVTGFKDTTNFAQIKLHYTRTQKNVNPLAITPVGPVPNILDL